MKHASIGVPSDSAIKYSELATGDDMITSMALQKKIGNLALCFPNSQAKVNFKRVTTQD